jgi:predicted acyltransferase
MAIAVSPERIRVESSAIASTASQRVMSIDALRGIDMFFIVGVEQVIDALSKMFPMQPTLESRLQHAPWAGFHFYDLIFPLFAFIIGVSIVFSLSKAIAAEGKAAASLKTIKRGVILFLLGVFLYGGMSRGLDHLRILGVLQRLAMCSIFGGLAFIWLNTRAIVALTVTLLAGYWAMMTFIPVPGFGAGDYAEGHNLANWIDKNYLPYFKWDGDHDPEGILSSLPAIASTLLGIFAGLVIKNGLIPPTRKVRLLLLWGIAGVVAGLLWHMQFPIIKKVWTSSFVLFTAGISSILLGLFYWMIDIKNWRAWAKPFVWIGTNAITIYVVFHFVNFQNVASRLVGGEFKISFDMFYNGLGDLITSLLALCFSFWFCKFLYDRKIFLRV